MVLTIQTRNVATRIDALKSNRHTPVAPYRKHLDVETWERGPKIPDRGCKGGKNQQNWRCMFGTRMTTKKLGGDAAMKKSGIVAALLGVLCFVGSSAVFAQVKQVY